MIDIGYEILEFVHTTSEILHWSLKKLVNFTALMQIKSKSLRLRASLLILFKCSRCIKKNVVWFGWLILRLSKTLVLHIHQYQIRLKRVSNLFVSPLLRSLLRPSVGFPVRPSVSHAFVKYRENRYFRRTITYSCK